MIRPRESRGHFTTSIREWPTVSIRSVTLSLSKGDTAGGLAHLLLFSLAASVTGWGLHSAEDNVVGLSATFARARETPSTSSSRPKERRSIRPWKSSPRQLPMTPPANIYGKSVRSPSNPAVTAWQNSRCEHGTQQTLFGCFRLHGWARRNMLLPLAKEKAHRWRWPTEGGQ